MTVNGPVPKEAAASEEYRYDAFISYRHVAPDREWAKWLHRSLETYRVPKKLAGQRSIGRRLKRVFRDEEELAASSNLSEAIETALRQARYLIVVCSPRTPKSQWVDRGTRDNEFVSRIGLGNPEGWPGLEVGWMLFGVTSCRVLSNFGLKNEFLNTRPLTQPTWYHSAFHTADQQISPNRSPDRDERF